MKLLIKTLLIGALSVSAPATYAQSSNGQPCGWTLLNANADNSVKGYIDYCKITGAGRYRFLWVLTDFKEQRGNTSGKFHSSEVTRAAFDCQMYRNATAAIYLYSDFMGQGSIVWSRSLSENEWKFKDYPPGSFGALETEAICKQ